MKELRFSVNHGVDESFLSEILLKDTTTLEALFELIDNSIDAAREVILERDEQFLDKYGLPERYDGLWIRLETHENRVSIIDNCSGIGEGRFRDEILVIGRRSDHKFGIGQFGIGLKRALYRLGTRYALHSDTGITAQSMLADDYRLLRPELPIHGRLRQSKGSVETSIRIRGLRGDVRYQVAPGSWIDTLPDEISRRYGIYLKKGLSISLNGIPLNKFGPELRKAGKVQLLTKSLRAADGVMVYVESGMHADYVLKNEKGWHQRKNNPLTSQYGWYFVCNDRIVEIATHKRELGWTKGWHQEYYGFVGWVRFVAADTALLPWDTKKSSINPHSSVFLSIAAQLQDFAEEFKAANRINRSKNGAITQPASRNDKSEQKKSSAPGLDRDEDNKQTSKAEPFSQHERLSPPGEDLHNNNWTRLLPQFSVGVDDDKLNALVIESMRLELQQCYSGTALLRALIERAIFVHLKATGSYARVMKWLAEEQRNGKARASSMKRASLSDMLNWLGANEDYYPVADRRDCVFSRNAVVRRIPKINGVIHEGDLINSSELATIRDDAMPLIRFLLKAPKPTANHSVAASGKDVASEDAAT